MTTGLVPTSIRLIQSTFTHSLDVCWFDRLSISSSANVSATLLGTSWRRCRLSVCRINVYGRAKRERERGGKGRVQDCNEWETDLLRHHTDSVRRVAATRRACRGIYTRRRCWRSLFSYLDSCTPPNTMHHITHAAALLLLLLADLNDDDF